uniref:Uncharacterized protein n=1 Tax=Megaselia scalaris TaxID=36166 RepID=T1GMK6_MEGSC
MCPSDMFWYLSMSRFWSPHFTQKGYGFHSYKDFGFGQEDVAFGPLLKLQLYSNSMPKLHKKTFKVCKNEQFLESNNESHPRFTSRTFQEIPNLFKFVPDSTEIPPNIFPFTILTRKLKTESLKNLSELGSRPNHENHPFFLNELG